MVPLAADGSEDDRGIEDDRGNIGSNFQTFVAPMAAEGMKDCGISVLGPGIGLVVLENVGKSLLVLGAAHASSEIRTFLLGVPSPGNDHGATPGVLDFLRGVPMTGSGRDATSVAPGKAGKGLGARPRLPPMAGK